MLTIVTVCEDVQCTCGAVQLVVLVILVNCDRVAG